MDDGGWIEVSFWFCSIIYEKGNYEWVISTIVLFHFWIGFIFYCILIKEKWFVSQVVFSMVESRGVEEDKIGYD